MFQQSKMNCFDMLRAAKEGNLDAVKYCEKYGVDKFWNRAMEAAAEGGHLNIVKYCESKGANQWNRAIEAATEHKHQDIVEYCQKKLK